MVTFTTDYWAPALDSKARRRMTESEERAVRVTRERFNNGTNPTSTSKNNKKLHVDITNPNKTFNNDYKNSPPSSNSKPNTPTSDTFSLIKTRTLSNAPSSPIDRNLSIVHATTVDVTPIVANSKVDDTHKKMSLVRQSVHKLFHHEPKGNGEQQQTKFPSFPIASPIEEKGEFIFINNTSDKLSIESMLKKYGVCEKGCIGKGATAVVRLAHKFDKSDSERTYAVKEFRKRKKNETEKEYVKKLTSEFCISSTLQHINVVRTVDLIQDENHNWCEVMEYCVGGDLYTAIKSGHMTPLEINCCFKQLIMGVDYLHDMGVAHRDIKPENLLLDAKGHLKITDFGVSDVFRTCWEEAAHMSKGLCGSEPYISPEQFETKEYDARLVDVWACGIVYYVMIYQGIPFRMATPTDPNYANYLEKRNSGQYEPFEKLPFGCRELMYKILEPNATKRINISKIKQDPWFKSIESCSDTSTKKLKQSHHHIPPEILKEIKSGNADNRVDGENNSKK
ncbi:12462_t:CDS:2 [Funneliformis caledonium]|uniref:non-specific serine/threonine protein kinase n=1 Tax=Funneliformis caledonium TaxID=1117310 RepID=A0A9N9DRD5_9GLOM|nr:12462_t:CDS:2 [Funneliformis caledonium]